MKILQVIPTLLMGGAEKLLVESVPLYQQRGLDVDALILKEDQVEKYKDNDVLYKEMYKKSSGKVFMLGNNIYNPFLIFKIIPYLFKYDVVHVHLFPALYWVAIAKIIGFSKTPLIYTEHNTTNRRRDKLFFKLIDKLIYRKYAKIVTISNEVDENLRSYLRFKDSHFEKIYHGVNLQEIKDAFPYDRESFFPNTDNLKILIQVARFKYPKDQETLIKSLLYLPDNVRLLLVGDGDTLAQNKALVKELGLKSRVLFLGIRNDIPELLKTSDIVILSSYFEGLSLSSIQGMASGRPFIGSDVMGLHDIVYESGILFPAGDEKKLAENILKLINDKNYYNEIANECVAKAEQYSIQTMIDKYIVLYNSLMQNKSGNGK